MSIKGIGSMATEKLVQYRDTNTGEIYKTNKERFSDVINAEGYRFPAHKSGARMFNDVQFPSMITDSEIGKMARLSKLMIPQNNLLGYKKNGVIYPYTEPEICELVNLSYKRGKEFIGRMSYNRLIRKSENELGMFYYINPAYFMANGQRLSMDLFILFQAELIPLLPRWVVDQFLKQIREKQVNLSAEIAN